MLIHPFIHEPTIYLSIYLHTSTHHHQSLHHHAYMLMSHQLNTSTIYHAPSIHPSIHPANHQSINQSSLFNSSSPPIYLPPCTIVHHPTH